MPLGFGKMTPEAYDALKNEFKDNDVPLGRYNAKLVSWRQWEDKDEEGVGAFFLGMEVTEDMEDPVVHGAKLTHNFGYNDPAYAKDPQAKKGGGAQTRIALTTMKEYITAAGAEIMTDDAGQADVLLTMQTLAEVIHPVVNVKVIEEEYAGKTRKKVDNDVEAAR